MEQREWRPLRVSQAAQMTLNPLRHFVDRLSPLVKNPPKRLIQLSIGDPTLYGNLKAPPSLLQKFCENALSCKYNGYYPAQGIPEFFSLPDSRLTVENVHIASSCSGALELIFRSLFDPGSNVLLPAPGFSLYETICKTIGVDCKFYRLIPEKDWQIDLAHLASLIDQKTVAILINNPSNPCGSVFSRAHLEEIVAVAERFKLPIISDEIYFTSQVPFSYNQLRPKFAYTDLDMIFPGPGSMPFIPAAAVSKTVPILAVSGLAKRYLVPGWRVGWVMVHDRNGLAAQLQDAIARMCALLLGANTVAQSVIREALFNTPPSFYDDTLKVLGDNATLLYNAFSRIPELTAVMPRGAMYMMLGIKVEMFKDIADDYAFVELLLKEEGVFLLPGSIFKFPNFVRLVICAPKEILEEAVQRIAGFCDRHSLVLKAEPKAYTCQCSYCASQRSGSATKP